jgi:hypothetical protein
MSALMRYFSCLVRVRHKIISSLTSGTRVRSSAGTSCRHLLRAGNIHYRTVGSFVVAFGHSPKILWHTRGFFSNEVSTCLCSPTAGKDYLLWCMRLMKSCMSAAGVEELTAVEAFEQAALREWLVPCDIGTFFAEKYK